MSIADELRRITKLAKQEKAQKQRRLKEAEHFETFYKWKHSYKEYPSLEVFQERAKKFVDYIIPRLIENSRQGRWYETLYDDYLDIALALKEIPRLFIIFAFNDQGITANIREDRGRSSLDGGKTYTDHYSTKIDLSWDKEID